MYLAPSGESCRNIMMARYVNLLLFILLRVLVETGEYASTGGRKAKSSRKEWRYKMCSVGYINVFEHLFGNNFTLSKKYLGHCREL